MLNDLFLSKSRNPIDFHEARLKPAFVDHGAWTYLSFIPPKLLSVLSCDKRFILETKKALVLSPPAQVAINQNRLAEESTSKISKMRMVT